MAKSTKNAGKASGRTKAADEPKANVTRTRAGQSEGPDVVPSVRVIDIVPPAEVAVAAAMALHALVIRDGGSAADMEAIDNMIRSEEDGIGWTWAEPYRKNGQFAWCGTFVAACYRRAGLLLPLARAYFPSTYRLDRFARYRPVSSFAPKRLRLPNGERGPVRELHAAHGGERALFEPLFKCRTVAELAAFGYEPKPGDIGVIGSDHPQWGRHVVLVRDVAALDSKTLPTVEGNAKGTLGDGKRGEGIVTNDRPVSEFRLLLRPAPLDLAPGVVFD